jgi:hypothetical protein
MRTNSKSTILRYIVIGYGILYFFSVIIPLFSGASEKMGTPPSSAEIITVILTFILYLAGTSFIWKSEKTAGILLCAWHFMAWAFSLLLWRDAGMILVLVFPMLFPAMLLIRNWYQENSNTLPTEWHKWDFTLRILLWNYAAAYILVIISDLAPRLTGLQLPTKVDDLNVWNFSSRPGIYLLVLFALFVTGFFASFRSHLAAGVLFIIWFAFLLFISTSFIVFAQAGPWVAFGITILVQGVFYLILHFRKKEYLGLEKDLI